MLRRALSLLALIGTLLLPSAVPADAGARTVTGRPHSRVVTYDHGVHVARLQLELRRSHGRVHGRVLLRAQSTTGQATTRTLRVGRCLHGTPPAPLCPPGRSFRVRIPASHPVTVSHRIVLHQPPSRLDAIEARLVRPGAPVERRFNRSDAELLVRGRAWRGTTAGHRYGVDLSPRPDAAIGRISVDAPATDAHHLYAYVVYTASGAALGTPETTFLRSPARGGDLGMPLRNGRGSGPGDFADRFDVTRRGAETVGVHVRAAGWLIGQVRLPWPA